VVRLRLPAGATLGPGAIVPSCSRVLQDVTCTVPALGPGGSASYGYLIRTPERRPGNGDITFQAEVDPSNIVRPEVSENNNRAQATINLQPAGSGCLTFDGPINEESYGDELADDQGVLTISGIC
jgi:hypothetical protein